MLCPSGLVGPIQKLNEVVLRALQLVVDRRHHRTRPRERTGPARTRVLRPVRAQNRPDHLDEVLKQLASRPRVVVGPAVTPVRQVFHLVQVAVEIQVQQLKRLADDR